MLMRFEIFEILLLISHYYSQVPEHRLKIAGKSIPIEKFCERRALKWLECAERQCGGLLLPQIVNLTF